ncbi:MAG: hypothetical protein M5U34_03245 [Chloroflexi bacterium]|nr:hypothetical protein [Chloroflexota bacterium]
MSSGSYPTSEKMLYDNALLARGLPARLPGNGRLFLPAHRRRNARLYAAGNAPGAGRLYSSYDADSEGEEGKFYVWQPAEIRQVLGEDAEPFMRYYDVTENGNWEGKNILHVSRTITEVAEELGMDEDELKARLANSRQKLYAVRSQRVWPGLDDKVLTAWNGLALAAFAEAGRLLHRPDYVQAAGQKCGIPLPTLTQKKQSSTAYLESGGRSQIQRLPGRLRLPGGRSAGALPDYLRRTLVHLGPRAMRHHADPLQRPGRHRLLRYVR